jgi:hypothetical protein
LSFAIYEQELPYLKIAMINEQMVNNLIRSTPRDRAGHLCNILTFLIIVRWLVYIERILLKTKKAVILIIKQIRSYGKETLCPLGAWN